VALPPADNVLGRIIAAKRGEVAGLRAARPLAEFKRAVADAAPPRDFLAALAGCPRTPVIAEIKRRSPSAGALAGEVDPADQARAYARAYAQGGAAALSVLTDGPFFGGSLADLATAKAAVALPVLRKDFIVDPAQVYESRAAGADAVLLIAAALEPAELTDLYGLARELGLAVLVEVHHERELIAALAPRPRLLGINNRDLTSLAVDLNTCLRLRPRVPAGPLVVAESGVESAADVARLKAGGLDAFLVGSSLMRAADPAAALAALTAPSMAGRP
jgi:indole-3-glycerol phosphate synthase